MVIYIKCCIFDLNLRQLPISMDCNFSKNVILNHKFILDGPMSFSRKNCKTHSLAVFQNRF